MVLNYSCDDLHRPAAYRFLIMVQRYKNYLNYANKLPIIFVNVYIKTSQQDFLPL